MSPAIESHRDLIYSTRTPAKLNIRLKVTGRRSDGYHELVSIMVPVDLCDLLEIAIEDSRKIKLICDGLNVPDDENNLVYRATDSFLSRAGIKKGVSVKLTKKIPVAAGLGGGSSDAAATLLSLNQIWPGRLPFSELHDMAAEIGADVPFFLYCRPAIVRGIGETLEFLEKWPEFWYVIVTPPIQVSTAWVYANLKLELTSDEYNNTLSFLKNDLFTVSRLLENDLEKVTSSRFPIIKKIKKDLLKCGAKGVLMTGSGPSVFGIFSSSEQAGLANHALTSKGLGDVFMGTNWERKS